MAERLNPLPRFPLTSGSTLPLPATHLEKFAGVSEDEILTTHVREKLVEVEREPGYEQILVPAFAQPVGGDLDALSVFDPRYVLRHSVYIDQVTYRCTTSDGARIILTAFDHYEDVPWFTGQYELSAGDVIYARPSDGSVWHYRPALKLYERIVKLTSIVETRG